MSAKDRLSDQLRRFVAAEPSSMYRLAEEAGVQRASLARFVAGERGLSLDSTEKICQALGLRLVQVRRRGRKA